jgi:hypothetical protein
MAKIAIGHDRGRLWWKVQNEPGIRKPSELTALTGGGRGHGLNPSDRYRPVFEAGGLTAGSIDGQLASLIYVPLARNNVIP